MEVSAEERELIYQHRKAAEEAQAKAWQPRTLASYADKERNAAFHKLHTMATGELAHLREHKESSKDFEHWCYEAVMELLGNGVWDTVNALER